MEVCEVYRSVISAHISVYMYSHEIVVIETKFGVHGTLNVASENAL